MTRPALDSTLSTLAAGLDEELTLLVELRGLSQRQRAALDARAVEEMLASVEARSRAMTALLAVASRLAPLRAALEGGQDRTDPALAAVRDRKAQVNALIRDIVAHDRETVAAAEAANRARDEEARALESGNTTLAAYKRTLALDADSAPVVSQRA